MIRGLLRALVAVGASQACELPGGAAVQTAPDGQPQSTLHPDPSVIMADTHYQSRSKRDSVTRNTAKGGNS